VGFFDRIRSGLEALGKRREERERDFLAANAGWARPAGSSPTIAVASGVEIDREGLQSAFLDQSGRIAYYLDIETGEVAEDSAPGALAPPRYRRVPARSSAADAAERRAFVAALEPSPSRDRLAVASDAVSFRRVLAEDRSLERAWYIFLNDRACAEVEKWLGEIGTRRSD
jgi:hypothetical protein